MKLKEYIDQIQGKNLTPGIEVEDIPVTGGYVSDLLSDVMGNAREGDAWITIMRHMNAVAVASMIGLSAVIFAKGLVPEQAVIDRAETENVCLISSPLPVLDLAAILYGLLKKK